MRILIALAALLTMPSLAVAEEPTAKEQAGNILMVACGIQHYCAADAHTKLDDEFIMVSAEASKMLGSTCSDLESVWNNKDAVKALFEFAGGVTAGGEKTCLAQVKF